MLVFQPAVWDRLDACAMAVLPLIVCEQVTQEHARDSVCFGSLSFLLRLVFSVWWWVYTFPYRRTPGNTRLRLYAVQDPLQANLISHE